MNWKKYTSIDNSYRDKTVNMIRMSPFIEEEFCCTEKVHGSNFSFVYDGVELRTAKKSSLLSDDANFFNQHILRDKYKDSIISIYNDLKKEYTFEVLTVYGETFGGLYNHPDVEKVANVTRVQKEIQYTPDAEFYAFDIRMDGLYLNYDKAVFLFEKYNVFHAKIIFRGSFEDCLQYSNDYETNIPQWLGLPPIEGNITEGNVIKPIEPCFFNSGERVILKNKNPKFNEKQKAPKKPKEPIKISDEGKVLVEEMRSFVNENRLRNVLSHIGSVTDKDFGKVMGEFAKDIWEDFEKDHIEKFEELDEKEQKCIKKMINQEASGLIRKNFLNIIDGEF